MYRIRFHGRGGQGMKTASRILGSAFFLEGFEVQDAPRYGAERRGAPMFAYVRASRTPINERGTIRIPDLVVVADGTLLSIPAAGVFEGCTKGTILFARSTEPPESLKERFGFAGTVLTTPGFRKDHATRESAAAYSSAWAGAAARLCGGITRKSLEHAVLSEIPSNRSGMVENALTRAMEGYEAMAEHEGRVTEKPRLPHTAFPAPEWIDLSWDPFALSAPAIHGSWTSRNLKTGSWRTMRPEMDRERCRKCWWNCSMLCPDSAISVDEEGYPHIDYDFCKGCLVCAVQCPRKAIDVIPENASAGEKGGGS